MENSVCGLFSGVLGCYPRAVERSTRRPLSIVERDRPTRPGKRRPPQAVSALSRSRLGCGVGIGRFLAARAGIFRALRCEGGVAREAIFNGGLLIIYRGFERPCRGAPNGRDPSPECVCAVGTVPGAVQSPRLAGRPPKSKWPRGFRVAKGSGRVAGGLAAPSETSEDVRQSYF